MTLKKILLGFAGLIIVFILWPSPIDPIAYSPLPARPLEGALAPNTELKKAHRYMLTSGFGPEDVAVDAEGRLYGGLQDGRIIRIASDGTQEDFITIEGGRPLGLAWDAGGQLIVADAFKGLLSVSADGTVTTLSTEAGGVPYAFADDVDVAEDGKIYFSDASDTYDQHEYMKDLLEARPHGRLLMYDPESKDATVLLGGLFFANGIAVSMDGDFVLVNETARYRVTRYWLKGEKAGTSDIFIDNLPGFPDGISRGEDGSFWLAIPSPRNPVLDDAHSKPWLKNIFAKLPEWASPGAIKMGMIIKLDNGGNIIASYQDTSGEHISMVTSVEQVGDVLYIGSLTEPQIGRLDITN